MPAAARIRAGRIRVGRIWARLWQAGVTLLAIAAFNFALVHLAPGSPIDVLAGENGAGDPAMAAMLTAKYGLDQPVWRQFLNYLWNLARLDLGHSYRENVSVLSLILGRLPATLLLMVVSLLAAFVAGVLLGVLASWRVNRLSDQAISIICTLFYAVPLFWSGIMLSTIFSVKLAWLPSGGMQTVGLEGGAAETLLDLARHLVLPATSLSLFFVALYARLVRASMLEVSRLEFVRAARARGLREGAVWCRHILRNAMLPMVTMVGVQIGAILGGAVVIETTFAWPGLGRLAFEAVTRRDYNLLMGIILFSAVLVLLVNALVDLLYTLLDPRIERAMA
jgi:peptide/nickel transport system permease protein